MKKMTSLVRAEWALLTLIVAESASAQEAAVRTSLNRALSLGTTVLFAVAAFLVVGGIVGAGWSMSQGDQDAKRKAMWAVGGGLVVGMATKIAQAMFDIGGGGVNVGS